MILPKISVVTPSFNQAPFLEETIQSVLSQGYPDLEYIVMDGGSTDGSAEIIGKYADRLTDWKSAKDGGQADAIRTGFARATGEILCWLNSDDTIAPGTLRRIGEFFAANPDVDLVYGDLNLVTAEGKRLYTARPLLRLGDPCLRECLHSPAGDVLASFPVRTGRRAGSVALLSPWISIWWSASFSRAPGCENSRGSWRITDGILPRSRAPSGT